jgi:hypothetical protein
MVVDQQVVGAGVSLTRLFSGVRVAEHRPGRQAAGPSAVA